MNHEIYLDGSKCGELTETEHKTLIKKASLKWGVWARGVGFVKLIVLVLSFALMASFWFQFFQEASLTKGLQIAALFVSQIVAIRYILPQLNAEIQAEYLRLVCIWKGLPEDGGLIIAKNGHAE